MLFGDLKVFCINNKSKEKLVHVFELDEIIIIITCKTNLLFLNDNTETFNGQYIHMLPKTLLTTKAILRKYVIENEKLIWYISTRFY